MPNKYGHNWFWHVYGNTSCSKIVDDVTQTMFLTLMLVFMANNDANSASLGLHYLSSLIFTMPAMENGEKLNSECPLLESHCWYIHDVYLKVCVSIIICHEDPQRH